MNTPTDAAIPTPRTITLGHCHDGGTGITNFSPNRADVYREAIRLHGDPLIVVSEKDFTVGHSECYSLHDLHPDVRRDLSPFWSVHDLVRALYESRKLFGLRHCGAAEWVHHRDEHVRLERELHLAKSPMVASEAAKAAARELLNNDKAAHEAAGMEWHHDEGDVNDVAAIITRHFQPGLEENERLKAGGADPELQADFKALYDDFVARGVECGNLRLRLATLNKELEEAREALEIANRSADDQMHQKRDAHAALAQCQRERDGAQNTVKRIWNALGLTTYEEAQPFPVWEHVLRIATDRDTLRAQLAQANRERDAYHRKACDIADQRDKAEGKVAALRQEVEVLRAWGNKDCTHMADAELARLRSLTPGAGERTT